MTSNTVVPRPERTLFAGFTIASPLACGDELGKCAGPAQAPGTSESEWKQGRFPE